MEEHMNAKVDSFTVVGREIEHTGGRGVPLNDDRKGDWCGTWTHRFYPLDPRPEDVKLPDLIQGLGNMSRYNGQCRFYSVAEHVVLVSQILGCPDNLRVLASPQEFEKIMDTGHDELERQGLMHDNPEFLMTDMTRPFKRAIGRDNAYFKLEEEIWMKAIAPRFGLPQVLPQIVLNADVMLLGLEKRVLHPRAPAWNLPFPEPVGVKINCFLPPYSHRMFIRRYCQLFGHSETALTREMERLWAEDRASLEAQFNRPLHKVAS
jgi:hypothetical protein